MNVTLGSLNPLFTLEVLLQYVSATSQCIIVVITIVYNGALNSLIAVLSVGIVALCNRFQLGRDVAMTSGLKSKFMV